MAHSVSKIICKKCTGVESVNKKKYKAKDRHSWKGIAKRVKNRESEKRARLLKNQSNVLSGLESVIYLGTVKRIREGSPESQTSRSKKGKCNCSADTKGSSSMAEKTPKSGILKRRMSTTDIIEHYRNPGLGQVASSVCAQKQSGVGINQRVATKEFDERKRSKKIRFQIPEGTLGYEDAKKAMWRTRKNENVNTTGHMDCLKPLKAILTQYPIQKNPHESSSKSIRPVIPVMERLKKEENIIERELDLRAVTLYIKGQSEKVQ